MSVASETTKDDADARGLGCPLGPLLMSEGYASVEPCCSI